MLDNTLSAEERADLREVASGCLCRQARQAARALTRFYDRHFHASGIEPTQFNLLVALRLSQPVSLVQLAGHLGLERTTLTRNLAILERDGLVQTKSGDDARQRLLSLTPAGHRTLKKNLSAWKKAHQAAIAALGKTDFNRLLSALSLTDKLTIN